MRIVPLMMIPMVLVFIAGCGSRTEQTPCYLCRGTGASFSGQGCTVCLGKGYVEVSKAKAARADIATENYRRIQSGKPPMGWWEENWLRLGGWSMVAGIIGYLCLQTAKQQSNQR